jgi:putative flippase GtrA
LLGGEAVNKTVYALLVQGGIRHGVWRELLLAARFGTVGIIATAVHIVAIFLLLSKTLLPTLVANMLAFLTAFGISFIGHYLWTFRSPGCVGKAIRRFLLISITAFVVNTMLLASLISTGWISTTASAIVSATVIPVITFLASRLWGFQSYRRNESTLNCID